MGDLRRRFQRTPDGLKAPNLGDEIEQRGPDAEQGQGNGPHGPSNRDAWRRLLAAVVAFAVFGGAAYFAWTAFEGGDGSASSEASPAPPRWLIEEARFLSKNNGDAPPTSARWVLTDAKTAAPAVGLNPDEVDAEPQYLVVLEGDFVARMGSHPSGVDAPSGTTLVFAADAVTHAWNDWGITNRAIEVPGLMAFDLTASGE